MERFLPSVINLPSFYGEPSRLLWLGPRRPVGQLHAELFGILRIQPLPAGELHGIATGDAADGSAVEQVIQNIESNVPSGSPHRDEAAIDLGPQRQARATARRLKL